MSIVFEERLSDSPYVETVTRGRTTSDGPAIRPAESCWHMVLVRQHGKVHVVVVGPLTTAGLVSYTADAELLWIKFKLGTFMPHLPTGDVRDFEAILPGAANQSFWLHGSAWQFPDYENADTFVNRLARADMLVRDPVVTAVLQGQRPEISPRTVRHRFLRATGVTHSHIYQVERAQRAAALLRQGVSIPDTMFELGYYDQPHMTRSLKQWVGHTPAQLNQSSTAP